MGGLGWVGLVELGAVWTHVGSVLLYVGAVWAHVGSVLFYFGAVDRIRFGLDSPIDSLTFN